MNIQDTITSLTDRLFNTSADSTASDEATDANDTADNTGNGGWTEARTPTSKVLRDVVQTSQGPIAVGAEGNVLARIDGTWEYCIDSGPATRHNALTTVDVTDDGRRVWFAGSSGALGTYDVETGRKHDYSAPGGRTSTWEAIAVTGQRGDERVRIANGSGEVLAATTDDSGCPAFGDSVKPGSGSTIPALDFGGGTCYAIDTSGNVFEKADDGWNDIGIENAQVNFFDLHASGDALVVAGGGGRIYRYRRACENWTPVDAGNGALRGFEGNDDGAIVVGTSGHIYRCAPRRGWTRVDSPVEADLHAVAHGSPTVAVGAGGVAIEREG